MDLQLLDFETKRKTLVRTLKDNDSAKFNEQTDDKKARPQNGTFGFSRHTSQRSKNQKSHFMPTHRQDCE